MNVFHRGIALFLLVILGACSSSRLADDSGKASQEIPDLPGARKDGSVLLPNQWSLRPVGRQIPLGDFPVNIAVTPNGRYAAVLHCGNSEHEISVVDWKTNGIVSRANVNEAFYGLSFSSDGKQLFCSMISAKPRHQS